MRLITIIFLAFITALSANNTATQKRNIVTTPPPEASMSGYRVIKRVYRVVDNNESVSTKSVEQKEPAKDRYSYFVGAGASYIARERSVVITTKKTGDTLNLDGRKVVADGTNYSLTSSESEMAPELELGISSNENIFYGAKVTLYNEFAELAAFTGIRFNQIQTRGFTPLVQVLAGVGYSKANGITPDNLTIGVFGGVEKRLSGDFLTFNLSASYQHRYWQKLEMSYGDEHWRDNEVGIRAAFRYAF